MTDWLPTLNATLDTLAHAAASQQDTTVALTAANRTLAQLESELTRMPAPQRAALLPQLRIVYERLTLEIDTLTTSKTKLGAQQGAQRHLATAFKSYGSTPK